MFEYLPHPHIEHRKISGPPTVKDAAEKVHGKLNARIGLRITLLVGSMWTAYLFTVIALISAPTAFKSGNSLIIIAWIAQTFLQLVLLPIIIVGQNVQASAADARSAATYKDAEAIFEEAKSIQSHLLEQDRAIEALSKR